MAPNFLTSTISPSPAHFTRLHCTSGPAFLVSWLLQAPEQSRGCTAIILRASCSAWICSHKIFGEQTHNFKHVLCSASLHRACLSRPGFSVPSLFPGSVIPSHWQQHLHHLLRSPLSVSVPSPLRSGRTEGLRPSLGHHVHSVQQKDTRKMRGSSPRGTPLGLGG